MVDTLKKCSFTGSAGDLSLEFESPSGTKKSVVIEPKGILQLMIEIQRITQVANENGKNGNDLDGATSWPVSFELHQYRFLSARDKRHLILHFLTKDNSHFGFPLNKKYAKQLGEELIECAEQLKEEDKPGKLTLVR
jgi:hypothetical protein